MIYKASRDTLVKVITIATLLLFLVIGFNSIKIIIAPTSEVSEIVIASGTLLFFIVVFLGCYLYAPKFYEIDVVNLIIHRPSGVKVIPVNEIAELRILSQQEMSGLIRTFGVGGLFGYFGKFYSSKIGHVTLFATQRENRIFIQTISGNKFILTPDDLGMLGALENLKKTINSKNSL